jgi:hypothetical protein
MTDPATMKALAERLRGHVTKRGGPAMVNANGAWQMMLEAATALDTAAAEIERLRGGVEVKGLDWSEIERDRGDGQADTFGEWEAPSILGVYAINISTCGDMHAPWEAFGDDDGKLGNFTTLDEAKAACQSDFTARIRSAIKGGRDHAE